MPLYGTLDITAAPKHLPTLANLDTEAWTLPRTEMMQLLIEVPRSSTDGLLPKAMHPALPSYVIFAITRYSDSPVGPFNLAMLRLGRRGGAGVARPLGLPGRTGRGQVPAPARSGDGRGEEGRQDHPRLRPGQPAAGGWHRRAVHQLGDRG